MSMLSGTGLERNQWTEFTELRTQDDPPHTQAHSVLLLGSGNPKAHSRAHIPGVQGLYIQTIEHGIPRKRGSGDQQRADESLERGCSLEVSRLPHRTQHLCSPELSHPHLVPGTAECTESSEPMHRHTGNIPLPSPMQALSPAAVCLPHSLLASRKSHSGSFKFAGPHPNQHFMKLILPACPLLYHDGCHLTLAGSTCSLIAEFR